MEDYHRLTYKQTCAYHEELRNVIFESLENEYSHLRIRANEISFKDANEADHWKSLWKNKNRIANWSWTDLYHQYHSRGGARRFDLGIKQSGSLMGLCYGELTRDRIILKLHALEKSPLNNNPLSNQFVNMTLFAANLYARLNDVTELWLCNPVSPVHVRLYESKGYVPQTNNFYRVTHLTKRLK